MNTKSRREFLKAALVGGGGAALLVASRGVRATPKDKPPAAKPAAPASQGYHVTPHIQEYYKTAAL